VPISVGGALFAIFNAFYTSPHEFTDDERRLLVALAQRAGLAIENAQLYEEARGKAALEERQRLARELHDSVSQVLYAIALNASAAMEILPVNPAHSGSLFDDVLRLAEAGLAEMRALIFELRPESLEQEGLVAALEKQAAAVRARYSIDIEIQCALDSEPDVLLSVKEALYRIAQEALQNAAKHAQARTGKLVLEMVAGKLVLRIGDDGKGFDPADEFPGHLGLRSMHERAAGVGGVLKVESAPGRGTWVSAWVPLV
jgi:signal transduction histidine kinase